MKRFLLLIIACCCFFSVHAAYLKDVPKTLTQPDGTILHCFASGDEFFNYLHDADGYTIMQHPLTGFYVYADKQNGQLVATDFVAGSVNPASKNLRPHNLISPQEWQARRNAWHENDRHVSNRSNPNHGTLNNISIFIRFSDDGEFVNSYSSIDNMFNDVSENGISMRNYFRSASYGSIEIPTYFYPGHSGETIISYQDNHPRSYFQPYNAVTNTNGYQTEDQRAEREFSLLERAVNYINANYPIPSNLNIDYDNDGYVDNVCFIVRGDVGEWSSLLWPHKWALQDRYVYINGKRVWTFNFQLADASGYFNTSTMCHEMNHSLSAPDLYHYNYGTNLSPAGIWDLMENDTWPPQHCGAYMKMKYGHWIDEIPEITEGGVYTLNPISSPTPDNVAYKIATEDPYQFYVVEYRDNTSLFESGLPGSGLLVYRIDTRFEGNAGYDPSSGIYDEVYIFRPGGSTTQNGNLSTAFFSANVGRTEFSASTSAYPFFTNGTIDNNFRIYNITEAGNTISFTYGSSADCEPPTNLMASVENNDVVLSWTAAVGAVSYNVYRNGSLIGNTTETSYLDGSPVFGTQNYYVKSMDSNGFLSSASESVEVNYEPEGTVFIGDGGTATNVYLPSYSYYCYTLSQQIYTAEEIGTQGSIRSISFYNDGAEKTRNYDIYLVATDKTAFQNNTDWIPVTASDLVFSGEVLMGQGWNTITLDVPFGYMGDSNLALIVDDNTGSYTDAPHMACRVFETDEVQAMRVYDDDPNFDPYNPSGYSGTLYSQKNQIVLIVDRVSSTPVVIPETFQLGYRPNEAWVRPFTFQIYNPGGYCVINSIATDNDYFQLEEVEFPIILGYHASRELNLTTGNSDGETDGHLIINYGDNEVIQVDLSAFAYNPVEPDVWEMARVVDDPTDYRDTPTTVLLNNDYFLPPTGVPEGNDAVYKVTFDHDVLLNGTVTKPGIDEPAENGKLVVYREGFEGVGGPDLENYYGPAIIGEPLELTAYPDGSNTTGYLPMYGYYADAYTRSQYVIPAAEITAMSGRTINSLTYYTTSTPNQWQSNFQVYLTEVNFTTMSSFVDPAAATIVYIGQLTVADGMMTVTFTTPYHYNGGNLLIGMDCIESGNNYSSCYFQAVPVTGAGMYAYTYNAPTFTSGNTVSYIPTTTFYCAPSYDPEHLISDMTIASGTYYIAASSTETEWDVVLNTSELSCPEVAFFPTPSDYDTDVTPTAVQLKWRLGERTTEYQLLLGTDYENLNVIVDWTRDLAETYTLTDLPNNTNCFWQIVERNDGCPEGVESPVWGFTTLLNGPQDLYAWNYDLYEGDDLTLEWTPLADTNILSYNIYQDNVLVGNTTNNYYTVGGLTYNLNGYNFHVTAVYAGGESNPSNGVGVWVSGNGAVEGHVYEVDGVTGIANATVTFAGNDEFGYYNTFTFTTDANGFYNGSLKAGTYSAQADCGGYQIAYYNNSVSIVFEETTADIDIVMDELFNPVKEVVAEYYPDATDPNSPYVKVYWSMNSINWLYYDDGVYQSRVGTNGGQFYWGVMFPAGSYSGNSVTKVSMYDCEVYTGNILICQGGTSAPASLIYAQAYSCTGSGDFVEWTMNSPVAIDPSQSLWIVMCNDNGNYPASGCANSGDPNGRWISLDGATWEDVTGYGLDYTWMLRAYVSNGRGSTMLGCPSPVNHNMTTGDVTLLSDPNATPHFVGTPAQANGNNRSFNHYRVYRTDAYNNGPYTEDNTVLLADDVTDTLFIDVTWSDADAGIYKFGVSRVYEGNRESGINWNNLSIGNQNAGSQPMIQSGYDDPNGPAPFVVVPENTSLPMLRTEGSEAIVARWHHGNDFASFFLNNPAEAYSFGFTNDVFTNGACYMNGTLYFSDSEGKFGIIDPENGLRIVATDEPFTVIDDNPVDGKMYGCDPSGYLYEINPNDGSYVELAYMPVSVLITFTITNDGRFIICDRGDDAIKEYDLATGTLNTLITFDWDIQYGQDMATDRETNEVYWAAYNNSDYTMPLIKIDLDSNTITTLGYFDGQVSAFAITGTHLISVDRESPIVWSNAIDKSMNLGANDVNITVALNSGDSPEGVTVSFTNLNQSEQSLYPIADVTLDATGYYAWNSFRKGDYQVQVSFDGYNTIAETVSIWDATSLNYVLSEIKNEVRDLYVSRTGWAMWTDEQHGNTIPSLDIEPNAFFIDFEDSQMPDGWTTIDANNDGYDWMLGSNVGGVYLAADGSLAGSGHNSSNDMICSGSYSNVTSSPITPDNYLVSPLVNIVNGSTFNFWACAQDANYAAEHFSVEVSDNGLDFIRVQEWTMTAKGGGGLKGIGRNGNNRGGQGSWYYYSVDLSAYSGKKYIAIRHFNCYDQFVLNVDDIELSAAAKGDRHFNNYQVELSDGEGNVLYQGTNSDGYMQLPVDNLTDGQTYHLKVASSYSSGMSEWSETDWVYQSCDNFETVANLNMEMNDDANVISWEYPTAAERSFVKGDYPAYGCMVYNDGVAEYQNGWFSFDLDNPGIYDYISTVPFVFGGDYCPLDGNVHATYEDNWYVINPETGGILDQGSLNIYYFYDCAWDYSTDMMYGVYGSDLYMWNVEDNTIVNIGSMGRTMMALACDLDGQLWGISQSEGALYKIDKTTGATTFVGSTGQYCYYVQSAGFDHYTGKLYWTGCGDSGFFAEVDTETGQATVLANNTGEVCSFCVPFDGGSYFLPVTGVLGALLYRDGELLGFTTQTSYTDTIATGSHEYEVRVVYDGMRRCPNYNAYYAMSCPLSVGGASYEVTVAANPAQGGSVTGAGSYVNGFPCTVTASANEGYAFTNWSMDGDEITDTPEYTFRVRDNVNMEANFIGITPHWEVVDNSEYNSQSLIGVVNVNGIELTGNYMEVAALCGDECRGRQMLTYYPEQDRFVVCMTIYGLEGDNITFDFYDHERGEETEFDCLSVLTFNSTSVVGTLDDPYIIRFGITQTTAMQTGWNWYSTIVKQEGNEGLEMLEASLGADGVMIKSQDDGFDINYGNLWMGNLNFIANDQMYMINANAPVEAVVSGISANVSDYPITLYSGWSWIGYPHAVAMDVNDALVNLNASNGDVLKTKHSFSTFVEGQGWFGTLNTLEPAMGMMYNSKKGSNTTFTYSDGSSREELAPNLTAENNHWVSNDFEYPDNMSVMAVVELDQIEIADGDYELAVFANGRCLGSSKLIYVEPINRYMAFLTITGEENQEMNFGLYHAGAGKEYQSASEMLTFVPNAIVGCIDEPYVVHFNGSADLVEGFASARIYPNPVERGALFSIDLSTDKAESIMVEVINALGETVSALRSSQTPIVVKAPNVSGVYTVRLVVEGKGSYSQKLIVR